MSLKTCLVDTNLYQTVIGETFTVQSNFGESHVSTDAQGCFVWTEAFDFNFSTDESYIIINGKITGNNRFKGARSFKVAFNPWSNIVRDIDKGESVKNLRTLSELKVSSLSQQLIHKDYLVKTESIDFTKSSINIELLYTAKPHLVRMDIDGKKVDSDRLTSGIFENTYTLLKIQNGTTKRVILDEVTSNPYVNAEGLLSDKLIFNITQEIPAEDKLEILVSSRPLDTPYDIGVAHGLVEYNSIKNNITGAKLTDLPLNYKHFYLLADSNTKSLDQAFNDHGFLMGEIFGGNFFNTSENQNFAQTQRNRQVEIRFKVVDTLVKKPVNSDFHVKIYNKESGDVIFNDIVEKEDYEVSGEMVVSTHMFYDEETPYGFQEYIVELTGSEAPFYGITKERVVYINPRLQDGFLLDASKHLKPEVSDAQIPHIYLKEFEMDFVSNDDDSNFFVNKNLELLSNRVVRIQFNPKLYQANNYGGETLPEITTGRYIVSLMVLTPKEPNIQVYDKNIDLDDFIMQTADVKDDVLVENGRVSIDMKLPHKFMEKQYLAWKNLIVLKMTPYNQKSQIRPGYVIGSGVVLTPHSKIESIYDTRIKNDNVSLKLSRNKTVINKFEDYIPEMQNKLQADELISDRVQAFKDQLSQLPNKEVVTIMDHENHSTKQAVADYKMFRTYHELSTFKNIKATEGDYNDLVEKQEFSEVMLQDLCAMLYDPNQKTHQTKQGMSSREGGAKLMKVTLTGYEYNLCLKNPGQHFKLNELVFMEKIIRQPGELRDYIYSTKNQRSATVYEASRDLHRSTAYFLSKGQTYQEMKGKRESYYTSFGLHTYIDTSRGIPTPDKQPKIRLKQLSSGGYKFNGIQKAAESVSMLAKTLNPFKFFAAVGPDFGYRNEEFKMISESEILSDQNRFISQEGQTFNLSEVEVSFEAEVTVCLLVEPRYLAKKIPSAVDADTFFDSRKEAVVSSPNRRIFCKESREDRIISEKWFLLTLNAHDINADTTLAKNSLAAVIRGEAAYTNYKEIESNKDLNANDDMKIIVHPKSQEEIVRRYKTYIKKQGKEIPYKDQVYLGFPGLYEPY